MEQCRQCGGGPVQGGWCRTCGMPAGSPVPTSGPAAAPARATGTLVTSERPAGPPPGRAQAMPVLLWAAIGALALGAVLCLTTLIGSLSAADALSTDELAVLASPAGTASPGFGLVGTVWLGLAAWFLVLGSRPARAFTLVGAVFGTCALVSGLLVVPLAAAALLTVGAAVVLVLVPDARAWFAGPYARPVRGPVSVLLVRTGSLGAAIGWLLTAVVLGVIGLVALLGGLVTASLGDDSEIGAALGGLLGVIGGFVLVAAVLSAGLAALLLWVFAALARTPPRSARGARVTATVLAGLAGLGALVAWDRWTLLGLAVAAVVIGALWVPDDARRHVGDAPWPAVGRLVERVHALGPTASSSAPAAAAGSGGSGRSGGSAWYATSADPLPTTHESAWSRQPPSGTAELACALCGTPVPAEASFCGTCGARVGAAGPRGA
ncbi:zinc ribbon domain-containing protein [Actinomycetospora sp. NBRC 106378]|uniref:zinc ribbon domain-containing protein n=1 Tax=Actinomycetospora sp. NBRC 106378 TaxID=3032208 RepID=UPI0025547F7F|nr:zinc ribbon domain-containing protein [Actinomycetospora sp. NBRC 106378]